MSKAQQQRDAKAAKIIDTAEKNAAILAEYESADVPAVTDSEIQAQLAALGYAVIPRVLSATQVEQARSSMWDALEVKSSAWPASKRIHRDRPATWNLKEFFPQHHMLLQNWGFGHSQLCWDVRSATKVRSAFAKVWGVQSKDLITSFDGFGVHFPPELTGRKHEHFNPHKPWFHTDQSRRKPDMETVQGLVNLYDVNPGDATLRVLQSSNTWHQEFFEEAAVDTKNNSDFYMLKEKSELDFFSERGCKPVSVLAKAGDLILWDSRTFHMGLEAIQGRATPTVRCVVYVCMTPRSWATNAAQEKRRQHFANRRMTTHNPHEPKLFGVKPRMYASGQFLDMTDLPAPVLSAQRRSLI